MPEPPRRVLLSALFERARKLYGKMLGQDHADILGSAGNLRALGEYERAREFDEDTLTRRRRVLGEDHPDTLVSVHNLAVDLAILGEYERPATSMRTL